MPEPLPPKPLDPKTAKLRALRLAATKPPPSTERKPLLLSLETIMPFGKHKGLTVASILDSEPSYITWLIENVPNIISTNEVEQALQEATDPRAPPKAWESPRY